VTDSDAEVAKAAGADCLVDTPELAAWLATLLPGRQLVIGGYIYLDGEAFVRAAVAMDAIMRVVQEARGPNGCALAFIDTPSHAHLVPSDAADFAEALWESRPAWQKAVQAVPGLNALRRARFERVAGCEASESLVLASSVIVNQQGPNYAMAKFICRWRCLSAVAAGFAVSVNTGPPALTDSVMHADMVGKALLQMGHFAPNMFYKPTTVEAIMTALLLVDVVQRQKQKEEAEHPMTMFYQQAWHGGGWRCPFVADSLGPVAFLLHLVKAYGSRVVFGLVTLGLIAYYLRA
jgi:hypothetical protein